MSPKARSTVRRLSLSPGASPEEQAHARGLNEGMLRKVNRIKQEIAAREALARKLVKKIGLREKRIATLEGRARRIVVAAELLVGQPYVNGTFLYAEIASLDDELKKGKA